MPLLTEAQMRAMMPNAGRRLDAHIPFIEPALIWGKITTPERIAAFLAQLAHESGEYRFMEELADGRDYEGRRDLGNVNEGDGVKYKGHGPIQITGRNNHRDCGRALGLNLIDEPTLLCKPEHGTMAAAWFWNEKRLSPLADIGWYRTITKRINGGYTHLKERVDYWNTNRRLFGLPLIDVAGEDAVIREFQRKHGLFVDGDAGTNTINKLELVLAGSVSA
jgi:predicted chitinase